MATKRIEFSGEVELTYDENSPEFKEAYDSYKSVINKHGTINDMLKHTSGQIIYRGIDDMVEGVGFVEIKGTDKRFIKDPFSGIFVDSEYNDLLLILNEGGK